MVTDEQVRLLRQKRMKGKSQEAAAVRPPFCMSQATCLSRSHTSDAPSRAARCSVSREFERGGKAPYRAKGPATCARRQSPTRGIRARSPRWAGRQRPLAGVLRWSSGHFRPPYYGRQLSRTVKQLHRSFRAHPTLEGARKTGKHLLKGFYWTFL